jgi:Rrf2 family nitric oxide-sensitive transcriptional repressor
VISQTAEYCLRAIVCLAATAGRPQTTHDIAQATKIPKGYLGKILQALGRAGMVSAQRGLNGGFLLLRDPASLSMLEIVRVADPSRRVTTCPLGIHGKNLCPLHRQLDEAAALAERALAGRSIAELMAAPGVPPLHNPAPALDTHSPLCGDLACLK